MRPVEEERSGTSCVCRRGGDIGSLLIVAVHSIIPIICIDCIALHPTAHMEVWQHGNVGAAPDKEI